MKLAEKSGGAGRNRTHVRIGTIGDADIVSGHNAVSQLDREKHLMC